MPQARNLPTWICEPTNEWAGTSGYEARKIYRDTEVVTHYSDAAVMFQAIGDDLGLSPAIGGRIELKNGLYLINSNVGGTYIVDMSSNAYGAAVQIDMVGENRDNVIIRNNVVSEGDKMIGFLCNAKVENITFDGNALGTDIDNVIVTGTGRSAVANNCKFIKHTGMGFQTFDTDYSTVTNCLFENTSTGADDQCALASLKAEHVSGNTFDKTVGEPTGSCLTHGAGANIDVSNNIIKRVLGSPIHGISVEPYSNNYENINIHDNVLVNARITIGGSGAFTPTYRRVSIQNNILYGDTIRILGPTSGDYSTQMKDIHVQGNMLFDCYNIGIEVRNTAGFTTVRNNVIKNTNASLATAANDGAIYLHDSSDIICDGNNIFMELNADADYNPFGIKIASILNSVVQNNRIINRTAANPNYVISGTNTGSLISKSK